MVPSKSNRIPWTGRSWAGAENVYSSADIEPITRLVGMMRD
jgi:hypothetical protein